MELRTPEPEKIPVEIYEFTFLNGTSQALQVRPDLKDECIEPSPGTPYWEFKNPAVRENSRVYEHAVAYMSYRVSTVVDVPSMPIGPKKRVHPLA